MGIYLNPTNKGFEIARFSKIYVDKTELIQYTNSVLNSEQRFICVSRPRRFGKSITAQMLSAYYGKANDSRHLFQGLKIETNDAFQRHLNQYDVLFFEMQRFLRRAESSEKLVSYLQKTVLKEIKEIYAAYVDPEEANIVTTLETIAEKTGQGFVFILDEWDCIFRETKYNTKAQKDYLDFLRDLFKGQTYVKLAYMTGILPIKKYGTHSALNIFYEYSMTSPKGLEEYTGFTEAEVRELCQKYEMDFSECQINPRKFQNDMTTCKSRDDVLTLLVHLGYLAYDETTKEVFIPNMEISDEFENAIEDGDWTKKTSVCN